jgi:hypothetical protein
MQAIKHRFHPELDIVVKQLLKHPWQHGYKAVPWMIWQDGINGITRLTGDLKVAKIFAICCVASTREGEAFFKRVLEGGLATWLKMVDVFQQILCYWTWLFGQKKATSPPCFGAVTDKRLVDRLIIQHAYDRVVPLKKEVTKQRTQQATMHFQPAVN